MLETDDVITEVPLEAAASEQTLIMQITKWVLGH